MKRRCDNPRSPFFERYGGRGIRVCDRWRYDFHAFAADMGEKPTPAHTIDRIDVNGNYTPDNCQWATRKEQQNNRQMTVYVDFMGERRRLSELSELSGLKPDTILARSRAGISGPELINKTRRVYVAGLAFGGKANGERQRAKTHCKHGHPFDDGNTSWTPRGTRVCKTCHKLKMRRVYARRRGEVYCG